MDFHPYGWAPGPWELRTRLNNHYNWVSMALWHIRSVWVTCDDPDAESARPCDQLQIEIVPHDRLNFRRVGRRAARRDAYRCRWSEGVWPLLSGDEAIRADHFALSS